MQKQAILKIYGKVQGVFFRDFSRRKAKELNLSGWVKNEPDGTVQIIAEGEEKGLKELFEWCKNATPASDHREGGQGPNHAKVDKVDVEWFNPTDQFNDFLIK